MSDHGSHEANTRFSTYNIAVVRSGGATAKLAAGVVLGVAPVGWPTVSTEARSRIDFWSAIHTPVRGLNSAGIDGEVLGAGDGERREGGEQNVLAHGERERGGNRSVLVGKAGGKLMLEIDSTKSRCNWDATLRKTKEMRLTGVTLDSRFQVFVVGGGKKVPRPTIPRRGKEPNGPPPPEWQPGPGNNGKFERETLTMPGRLGGR